MDFLPDMIRRHPAEDNFSAARSEQADERRCLLVLGMHRSGTSALTRVLNLLGADLPATLAPPADDNETGFWSRSGLLTITTTCSVRPAVFGVTGALWT